MTDSDTIGDRPEKAVAPSDALESDLLEVPSLSAEFDQFTSAPSAIEPIDTLRRPVPAMPHAQDMADKTALLLIDIGTPMSASGVRRFLRHAYADHRVFDSPFGALGRRLFTALFRPSAARNLRRALDAVGNRAPEVDGLARMAELLCERLNAGQGLPAFTPFVAFQYEEPTIEQALQEIRCQDFTQIVALWSRPFASQIGVSAREKLLRSADAPGTPPVTFIENWMDVEALSPAFGGLLKDAIDALPESQRRKAHIAFALQALPIEGDRDPALAQARALAKAALASAELQNEHSVVYLDALEPRAPLAPTFDDLLFKLGKSKPPLVVVPLNHLVENLSTRAELDVFIAAKAKRQGFAGWSRLAMPDSRSEILDVIEVAILRHLTHANEFRAESGARRLD
ncbi:MAG: ferrochelatase [Myxococcales bacterium]|jgi:protoheme ferro-lyase|nr:ferrochelatase [Myxococcales bacterium]